MKSRFGRAGFAWLVVLGVVTACASNNATIDDGDASISAGGDGSAGQGGDSGGSFYDSTGGGGSDTGSGGGKCVSHCATDHDCQSSCPPAPNNGINCCDTASGVCFGSTAQTCAPAGGGDGGTD
jgi:hypothetical protein